MKKKIELIDVVVWILAILAMFAVIVPFLNIIALSLSSSTAILQGRVGLFPVEITLQAYREMLKTPKILIGYRNSFLYTGGTALLSLVLCGLTAYPLSRKKLPGRGKLIGLVVFTMFFSGGLIPFYILIQNLHLQDNILVMILPWAIPQFQLLLLKNYFENVPEEIYEAAIMDGASEYTIFRQIFIPLGAPIFATIAVMIATNSWNDYMGPLMYINTPSKYPLQLVLQQMLIEDNVQNSPYMTSSALTSIGLKNVTVILSVLPLVIAYPFLQKYFIGSIYAGSVKG